MKKTYLLAYSHSVGSRDEVKEWADKAKAIEHWRTDLPNCFYLVSSANADELANDFRRTFNNRGLFLITELSDNHEGALPVQSWSLFVNPGKRAVQSRSEHLSSVS